MTSTPPAKRKKPNTPKTPHSVIQGLPGVSYDNVAMGGAPATAEKTDNNATVKDLPGIFLQLNMPVPDGAMDDAPATEDEKANNASVKSRLEYQEFALEFGAVYYRMDTSHCVLATKQLAAILLPAIFNTSQDFQHKSAYEAIIIENPWLVTKLFDAYKSREYHKIRRLAVFRPLQIRENEKNLELEGFIETTGEGKEATVKSWDSKFVGDISTALHGILHAYMNRTGLYARVVPHVQSSGTGKSRAHDELAKRVLYIPLNLAGPHATTYPPRDVDVCEWFSLYGRVGQQAVRDRCHAFLHALLSTTQQCLEEIANDEVVAQKIQTPEDRLPILASEFRDRMAEGRTFKAHGAYRKKFYSVVFRRAKRNEATISKRSALERSSSPKHQLPRSEETDAALLTIEDVADEIVKLLDPEGKHDGPHVVICWDESHSLTQCAEGQRWSIYSELLRALHTIIESSFISIFLSTAGNFYNFFPRPRLEYEPSARVMAHPLEMLPPITTVGFDQFSEKVDFIEDEWSLSRIASTHHMVHLGRALFPTRFDNGDETVKKSIVTFAADKLLCRSSKEPSSSSSSEPTSSSMSTKLNPDQSLACLAIRLGLDFIATWREERKMERTQVERHMRMYIHATEDFRTMVTVSPSEPLLAEASATIMKTELGEKEAPSALLDHIKGSYVRAGERSELVAALILLLARDKATQENPQYGGELPEGKSSFKYDGMTTGRVITALQFVKALVPSERRHYIEGLKPHPCSPYYPSSTDLATAFSGAYIYFNHFIKVYDFQVINRAYIWRTICRGAAIICANNQSGVDILIPVLMGTILDPKYVTAILVQVKNDDSLTDVPSIAHFTMMNPFHVGLFSKDDGKASGLPPVLRIVFALASKKAIVKAPSRAVPIPTSEEEMTQKERYHVDLERTMHAAAAFGDPHYTNYIVNLSTKAASARVYNIKDYVEMVGTDAGDHKPAHGDEAAVDNDEEAVDDSDEEAVDGSDEDVVDDSDGDQPANL
ncbi:hypothetical protein APHAL10511_008709 [Amanita phalloides]|nr:hypothetical protein APHAL10511_008709 [Amanita phalloides]